MDEPITQAWRHPLLRHRAQQDPEFGLKVAMWCEYGYKYAKEQLAGVGTKISVQSLRNYMNWWDARMAFEGAEAETRTYEEQLRDKFPEATEEEVRVSAQEYFEQLAMERENVKEYCELQYLRLAKLTEGRKGAQEEAKIALAARKVALAEEKERRGREKQARKGGISRETLSQIEEAAKLL